LPEYFAHAYRLLKAGGLFLNHGIARRASLAPAPTSTAACCAPPRMGRDLLMGRVFRYWLLGEGSV
jgi:cyclopropane fatty-acyl-phospholipid synthase-like methyltransferase